MVTEKLHNIDYIPKWDLMDGICKTIAKRHDELIFAALKSYGIDRDNISEHADRIYGVRQGDEFEHFFIDGMYGFSVHSFPIVWDDLKYSAIGGLEIEVIPSMIGMRLSGYESLNSSR